MWSPCYQKDWLRECSIVSQGWFRASTSYPVMLVLVLVLKDSLRTKMQFLSWSLSLTMQSLSLLLKSLSLSWSLNKSPWSCPCVQFYLKVNYALSSQQSWSTPERQLADYLHYINSPEFESSDLTLEQAWQLPQFKRLQPLFQRLFCTPATSAPVERFFSQSGLLMRPHRAKLSDTMLETLVYLKCNQSVE